MTEYTHPKTGLTIKTKFSWGAVHKAILMYEAEEPYRQIRKVTGVSNGGLDRWVKALGIARDPAMQYERAVNNKLGIDVAAQRAHALMLRKQENMRSGKIVEALEEKFGKAVSQTTLIRWFKEEGCNLELGSDEYRETLRQATKDLASERIGIDMEEAERQAITLAREQYLPAAMLADVFDNKIAIDTIQEWLTKHKVVENFEEWEYRIYRRRGTQRAASTWTGTNSLAIEESVLEMHYEKISPQEIAELLNVKIDRVRDILKCCGVRRSIWFKRRALKSGKALPAIIAELKEIPEEVRQDQERWDTVINQCRKETRYLMGTTGNLVDYDAAFEAALYYCTRFWYKWEEHLERHGESDFQLFIGMEARAGIYDHIRKTIGRKGTARSEAWKKTKIIDQEAWDRSEGRNPKVVADVVCPEPSILELLTHKDYSEDPRLLAIQEHITTLSRRDRFIFEKIVLYNWKQDHVSRIIDISSSRVNQIFKAIINDIRNKFADLTETKLTKIESPTTLRLAA